MNTKAYFGKFGGQFVPETVMFALDELEAAYERIAKTAEFEAELDDLLKNYGYDYFYIARHVISCCAVDSVPVKIVVEKSFSVDYPDGTWLIVKGKLSQKVINGQAEYVITQPNTTKISQPKYPYELMGI